MLLVNANDKGSDILVKFTVTGVGVWNFWYEGDKEVELSSKKAGANPFSIGTFETKVSDIDNWEIALANIANIPVVATAKVEWLQDGQVLATWSYPSTSPDGKLTIPTNSAIKSGDSIFFS